MENCRQNQDQSFVENYRRNRQRLAEANGFDIAEEHDACGVGFIAAIDGEPRRSVVEKGIEALKAVWHRGAVDADGKTGDGAGIHVQIPQRFFKDYVKLIGYKPPDEDVAVGALSDNRQLCAIPSEERNAVERDIDFDGPSAGPLFAGPDIRYPVSLMNKNCLQPATVGLYGFVGADHRSRWSAQAKLMSGPASATINVTGLFFHVFTRYHPIRSVTTRSTTSSSCLLYFLRNATPLERHA
jgi:hypothetical protein